jgi:von Willebrand factor type A domain
MTGAFSSTYRRKVAVTVPDDPPDRVAKAAKVVAAVIALLLWGAASWWAGRVTHPVVAFLVAMALLLGERADKQFIPLIQRVVEPAVRFLVDHRAWALALALVFAGTAGGLAWHPWSAAPALADGCPQASELRVLTSIDGLEPARDLARRYAQSTAERNPDNPGCPTVHPFVYAASTTAAAISALARSWGDDGQQDPLVSLGPRPDVWLPDSTVDVRDVRDLAIRAKLSVPVKDSDPIGLSPVVLATRLPVPGANGTAPTWPKLLSAVHHGSGSALLVANPKTSSAGLLAAVGYLGGEAGKPLPLALARERVREIVVAGADTDGSAALLCQWVSATAPAVPGSVVVSSQTWRRFAAGDPPGRACPGARILPVPVVPAGTPVLDHPYVKFHWSTPAQSSVVKGFQEWLSGTSGRDALTAVGLEPVPEGCSGLDTNACVPSADALDRTLKLYLEAQKPGRVLLALDASGSMTQQAGPKNLTRFGVASQAVGRALGQMGPTDQFGLWTFAGLGGRGQQRLVGIAAGNERHRADTDKALRAVHPAGGTPLYDTVVAGMKAVAGPAADAGPRALVVLTDGQDTTSATSAQAAQRQVRDLARTTGSRLFLIATGEATCSGPQGLRDLAVAGAGGCFDAKPDQLDDAVAQLFNSLWKGQ